MSIKACVTNEAGPNMSKTLHHLEDLHGKVNQIFAAPQNDTLHEPASKDQPQHNESQSNAQRSGQPSNSSPYFTADKVDVQVTQENLQTESKSSTLAGQAAEDVEMVEAVVGANAKTD